MSPDRWGGQLRPASSVSLRARPEVKERPWRQYETKSRVWAGKQGEGGRGSGRGSGGREGGGQSRPVVYDYSLTL